MKRIIAAAAFLLLAGPALAAEDGESVYGTRCAICHGPDGKGSPMGKKMGSPELGASKLDAAGVEKIVTDGKGKMMGFKGKLTPEQIKAVSAHVQKLK